MMMSGEKCSGSMDVMGGLESAVVQQGAQQVSEDGAVESESSLAVLVIDSSSSDESSESEERHGESVESRRDRGETLLSSSRAARIG